MKLYKISNDIFKIFAVVEVMQLWRRLELNS